MARRRGRRRGGQSGEEAQRELQKWMRRCGQARQVREQWEQRYAVEQLELLYGGFHGGEGRAKLNHFFATIQAQRPALLPSKLSFTVHPRAGQRGLDDVLVRGMAGVLDAIARQDAHLLPAMRLAVTQAFFRLGALKVCYEPTLTPNPRRGRPLVEDPETGEPLLGPDGTPWREPEELLTQEAYRWEWVDARHLLLPDEGPDRSRWTWIGEEIEVPLDEAQHDHRFSASKRQQLRANGRHTRDRSGGTALGTPQHDDGDADEPMLRYTECWDMRQQRYYIWADGQAFGGCLLDDATPDGVEDHPYAFLMPLPVIGPIPSPWPKPLTFDWLPLQLDYNDLREQQITSGKRAARKILYDQQTFPDVDEAQKFLESSIDMQAVQITDLARPPLIVGDGALGLDVARNIPSLLADWQRVTGASGTRLGAPDDATATEALIAEQQAGVRESELRTLILEWLAEAGAKMLQLVRQTLTLDLWVQYKEFSDRDIQAFLESEGMGQWLASRGLHAPPGMPVSALLGQPGMREQLRARFGRLQPMRVAREQLQYEADVEVVPTTIRPLHRAQLLQLANLLGPLALTSPTLLEEIVGSFELPRGEQIAAELLRNMQQQHALQGQGAGTPGAGTPGAGTPGAGLPTGATLSALLGSPAPVQAVPTGRSF